MRNDRRTPHELADLLNRRVKLTLSSFEKRTILADYKERIDRRGFQENCSTCWASAIRELARLKGEQPKNAPILVKEKMIVAETPKKEVTYADLSLKELREMFPTIKATSVAAFLTKIEEHGK
jgi:hypothetical protein